MLVIHSFWFALNHTSVHLQTSQSSLFSAAKVQKIFHACCVQTIYENKLWCRPNSPVWKNMNLHELEAGRFSLRTNKQRSPHSLQVQWWSEILLPVLLYSLPPFSNQLISLLSHPLSFASLHLLTALNPITTPFCPWMNALWLVEHMLLVVQYPPSEQGCIRVCMCLCVCVHA